MHEITALTAAEYLHRSGHISDQIEINVRELTGGVSNIVLRVDVQGRPPFVIKQCRERLRVAMDWRAPLERIWIERAAIDFLHAILPDGTVPTILFEDRPEYLFAMTCAPDDAVTWKTQLLAGQIDPRVSARLGTILATIHTASKHHTALRAEFSDTSLFEQLRIDPYYRTASQAHPDLAPTIDALICAMARPPSERTLVLGDFSPKNILVHSAGLILLDFECGHAGDPAFDLGFFLSHLLLKTVNAAVNNRNLASSYLGLTPVFWQSYLDQTGWTEPARSDFVRRSILHVAACTLARVDGKSPVEYLNARGQSIARAFAREALRIGPDNWVDLCTILNISIGGKISWQA